MIPITDEECTMEETCCLPASATFGIRETMSNISEKDCKDECKLSDWCWIAQYINNRICNLMKTGSDVIYHEDPYFSGEDSLCGCVVNRGHNDKWFIRRCFEGK